MTREDKELLLKDLCARVPYGVKCCIYNFGENTIRIKEDILWTVQGDNILTLKSCIEKGEAYMYYQIKPYLFPLSSMTESQNDSWRDAWFPDLMTSTDVNYPESEKYLAVSHAKSLDWLYKNHFDIYGLIERGLAIDATNKNIY